MTDVPPPIPGAVPPPPPPPPAEATAPAPQAPAAQAISSVCPSCGDQLAYVPGTMLLKCATCGTEVPIKAVEATITEHSLDDWEARNPTTFVANVAAHELRCQNCGATTETTNLASKCQFCGGALVATDRPEGLVAPEGVIPFQVQNKQAHEAFGKWVTSRWFAPNALKKVGSTEGLTGTYIPHWTYDSHTETDYTGQRGDYYYTTETREVSDGQGGTRTETYQERHTAWRHASGHVARDFDDVLVLGSHALDPKKVNKMGPWRLADAKPFQDEFLTGFAAVRYDLDPQAGAEQAKQQMVSVIEGDVRSDIGGDEQRISGMDVAYSSNTFKLLLMPLWIATYVFAGKTWQVMVNANTGEVVGDRPYSPWKITFATIVGLLLLAAIIAAVVLSRRH
ncbi:hypothetical protein GCM10028801_33090 [Nocardioides maradonensis]